MAVLQEVLRGYFGDKSAKPIFDDKTQLGSAFNLVGTGYQRPFELATVRLNNMVGSLSHCAPRYPLHILLPCTNQASPRRLGSMSHFPVGKN